MEGPKLLKATHCKGKRMMSKGRMKKRTYFSAFSLQPSAFNPKGFTLIEVMIALVIVSVTVIAVFNLVNYHVDVAYEHTIKTRMLLMAREKISEMEANLKNSKGAIPGTVFTFENLVNNTKDEEIIELKTIINGDNKKVVLRELVLRKQTQEPK